MLGAPAGSVINGEPLGIWRPPSRPQPGARRPNSSPGMSAPNAPDLRLPGRRRRPQHDPGRDFVVTPSDSLAVLAEHATWCPAIAPGSPASRARCRPRARRQGRRGARHPLPRDAHRLEVLRQPARRRPGHAVRRGESYGTGSNHVREKGTACGRCCSGSTCSPPPGARWKIWRASGRASAATTTRATTGRHPSERADALMAELRKPARARRARLRRRPAHRQRRRLAYRPGRRLGQHRPGRAPVVRRRQPHRVPPVGHRREGATFARLPSGASAADPPTTTSRYKRRSARTDPALPIIDRPAIPCRRSRHDRQPPSLT